MDPNLRPYKKEDLTFCNALIERNMQAYFDEAGISWDSERYAREMQIDSVWVVFMGIDRAGFIHLSDKENDGYINTIQIDPKFRNRGIGSYMMNWVEDECKRNNKRGIQLSVYAHSPAFQLYKRLGYIVTDEDNGKYLMRKGF